MWAGASGFEPRCSVVNRVRNAVTANPVAAFHSFSRKSASKEPLHKRELHGQQVLLLPAAVAVNDHEFAPSIPVI
jgi:hypothetical protein